MRTNIVIDDDLMALAMRCCGKSTKRETVAETLTTIWVRVLYGAPRSA